MKNSIYQVAVIGAGPAGIKAVSELAAQDIFPILWIDPQFECGELYNYQHIMSNTEVYCNDSSKVSVEEEVIQGNTWIKKNKI